MRCAFLALVAACGGGHGHGGGDGGGGDGATCSGPGPASGFAVATGDGLAEAGPYAVVTGTLPAGTTAVEVDGSARGVRVDAARGVWSYLLAAPPGDATHTVVAHAPGGDVQTTAHIVVGTAAVPARDLAPTMHTVGSWMFSWFTGDTSWRCSSPWQPPAGFQSWDGSVAWARTQLLDQIDAHLDLIGLQLDTNDSTSYRLINVEHVIAAAGELWAEGYAPPRVFPFLDTAIIANHWMTANGSTLDLSTTAGQAYLYDHAHQFYAAAATLGAFEAAAIARSAGSPYVGLWHSTTINGESSAAVLDFKSRFQQEFGANPYLVAHPNDWRTIPEVDEITLMFGPPQHYNSGGRDGGGAPTLNIEAGFWNPTSNTFYLAREGGTNFDAAWASAQAARATAHHLYIDSWNETGEGSGIFEAAPVSYAASDTGPCGSFTNQHAESWAATGRHYIDTTRVQASTWNDAPPLDARVLAHDLPTTLAIGEQRWATVVLQNTGDDAWTDAGLVATSPDAFGITAPTAPIGDVPHGYPAAVPVLLSAPCASGSYTLKLRMTRAGVAFGDELAVEIAVP